MLKKVLSFLTAAMVTATMICNVSAAETSETPEFTRLLYKMDLSSASAPSDAGITTPAGTWTIETGSEGGLCLKSTDAKASLIVGDDDWQNYKTVINYKMVQSEDYDLVSPATDSTQYNMLRVSVCPRNIDTATYGKYCKYVYTNPPRYSGHYLEEYYYDGSNSNVRNYSTSTDYAIGRNSMQTITTTNYNSGENVKFITSVNGNETDIYSVYHNTSSTVSMGPLAVIFEDAVKGYTFEDMGYAVEIYGIEVYGEKPEVVPVTEKTYNGNLYVSDFANDEDFAATGLTAPTGTWTIETGTTGEKCLKGTLDSGGAASLIFGEDSWTDCEAEIAYKLVQSEDAAVSSSNKLKTTVFTRSGDTLGSGNFIQYRFDNPAYYSNYFGGYSKNGSSTLAIVKDTDTKTEFKSGTSESAMLRKNAMQTVKVSEKNIAGTDGATIVHSVEFSNGTDTPYTASVKEWAGTGSGILSGKAGVKFENIISDESEPMYVEVYSIKVTGAKTFTLAYLNDDGTAATEFKSGADITVTGSMADCTINSKNYGQPAVITAVYDNGILSSVNMQNSSDVFNYKVKLPQNTENCTLKTFVWGSAGDMYPVFGAMNDLDAN